MAENPLSIRVSEQTKALFNELVEQGEFTNKGEFLNRLLTLYQTEKTKDNVSMLKPAIEAVETLTSRLLEVLNGAGAIITTKEEKHKQELDEQRTSYEETRTLLQQRITSLEGKLAEDEKRIKLFILDKELAESNIVELQKEIGQLENIINDKTALIEEYKNKNDTLNSIVSEYKAAAAENKDLSETVNNLKQVNEQQQRQINELIREQHRQVEIFEMDQENLRNSLLLQRETSLLKLKQEFQIKAEEQQAKHTAIISTYENKVKDLLNLLGSKKSAM